MKTSLARYGACWRDSESRDVSQPSSAYRIRGRIYRKKTIGWKLEQPVETGPAVRCRRGIERMDADVCQRETSVIEHEGPHPLIVLWGICGGASLRTFCKSF